MMDDAKNTYKVPTPQDSLESQIMDPNFPKNEREWWASEEITRLRAEVEAERTNAALARAFHDVAVQQRNAAWSESDRLRAEVEALRDANERLNVAVAEAERIVRAYARRNPRHEYKGVIQDPFGAHGWLDRFDAARAAQGGKT